MRIAIDLDGTICSIKQEQASYADVVPLRGARERIAELRMDGHYIIIITARNMKTCDSNVGKVMKNVGKVTLEWLDTHGIEYDEIYFGKPNAEVYLDDRALRFSSWDSLTPEVFDREAKER
jgi:capsule biosynthesis phosphatase